jgi:hypothetical protein
LKAEWGGDLGANLGYVRHWLHSTLTSEQRERAMDANILSVPVIRFLASVAREATHSTTATTTPTGKTTMSETLLRPAAEKRFRELTAELHNARARQDRLRATELANERDLLAQALYPGTNAPNETQRQVIG